MEPENVDFEDSGSANISVEGQGGRLSPGSILDARYHIFALVRHTAFGETYRANDKKLGHTVAVSLIRPELLSGTSTVHRLKQEIHAVRRLDHKNVAQILDVRNEGDSVYIVSEWVDGSTLRELIAKKQEGGSQGFSVKGAYNVMAHVCNALAYAHQHTYHGALSGQNILVNKAGRVKVTEFGLARGLPAFARVASTHAGIAPEIAAGGDGADGRADLYSLGSLFFELLLGKPPSDRGVSELGAYRDLARLIARCLSQNPAERPKDVAALKGALHLIAERGAAATSAPVAEEHHAPAARAPARPATTPPQPPLHALGSAHPAPAAFPTPPAPAPVLPARGPAPPIGRPSASGAIAVDENEEKWLINKGKLDFGPFSLAQIKEQVLRDEILPEHIIIDNESGRRERVEENPLLHDIVHAAAQRRDEKRRAHAEHHVVKAEKRKGFALYGMILLGIVAIGLGGFYGVKKLRAADKKKVADVKSLESAELQVTIAFKPQPPRKAGGSSGKRSSRPAGAKGGYDDSLDLGDASEGDEESGERLDNSQLNAVISRYGSKLGGCLGQTGEPSASVEFIVAGSTGKVTGVRVNGKTDGALANCIRGRMASMQFPTFNGPRTKGTFDMSR